MRLSRAVPRRRVMWALVAPLVLQGCADRRGVEEGGADDGAWGAPRRLEEDLRIDANDAGPASFGLVNGLTVDDSGRIIVADLDHRELRVFDGRGRHLRTIGREGEGPGELGFPVDVAVAPDGEVWVLDVWNRRYSIFGPDGEPRRSRALSAPPDDDFPMRGTIAEDGRFSLLGVSRGAVGGRVVFRLTPDLNVLDSVFTPSPPPDSERCIDVPPAIAQGRCVRSPLSVRAAVTFDRDGNVWSADRTDVYRLVKRSPAGDTLAVTERDVEADPVSEDVLGAVRTTFFEEYPDLDGRFTLTASELPSRLPYFDVLWANRDGSLWARRSSFWAEGDGVGSETRFDVFDPTGRFLGQAVAGVSLEPPFVLDGNLVYGVTRDGLDVPYVVRLRLVP